MTVTQAIINEQPAVNGSQAAQELALFHSNGDKLVPLPIVSVSTSSAIGTVAKSTSSPAPHAGTVVAITFVNGNSASNGTFTFAGSSAVPILLGGTATTGAKHAIASGGVGFYLYDGTSLHQMGAYT